MFILYSCIYCVPVYSGFDKNFDPLIVVLRDGGDRGADSLEVTATFLIDGDEFVN